MTVVKPTRSRAVLQQGTFGPRLVIPAPRRTVIVLFVALWLCAWFWGLKSALSAFRDPEAEAGAHWFMLLWLGVWVLGGAWAILILLWSLVGREVVSVERGLLIVRQELLGFGRKREYDLAQVRDVRTRGSQKTWGRQGIAAPGFGPKEGTIVFDYGAATFGFGLGLEEGEAKVILEQLQPYLGGQVAR